MARINDYVVLDTETTGLSPVSCKIIEVCASRVRNGQIVDTFTTLINPGSPIPYYIPEITGITDDIVWDKPYFHQIADKLKEFIGCDVIVGHNIPFDIKFLNAAFGEELSNEVIDTLTLAKAVKPGLDSYRLEALCKEFGIADKQLHRAEADVFMTYKLFDILQNTSSLE